MVKHKVAWEESIKKSASYMARNMVAWVESIRNKVLHIRQEVE